MLNIFMITYDVVDGINPNRQWTNDLMEEVNEGTAVASRPSGSIPRDPFIAIINKIEMNQDWIFLQRSLVNKVNKNSEF